MRHTLILFCVLVALTGCGSFTKSKPKVNPKEEFVKGCIVAITLTFPNQHDLETLLAGCEQVEKEFRIHENQKERPEVYIENFEGYETHAI